MPKIVLRGRSEAMATALGMLRRVRGHGHGGVILIEGEPGIGKTAVFTEIVTQATRMTFACAVGKTDQIGRISPAAPLLLALRSGTHPLVSATDLADLVARTTEPLLEDLTGRRSVVTSAASTSRRCGSRRRWSRSSLCAGGVSDPVAVRHWETALQRLCRIPGPRPAATPAPYRGLASFGPDDAEWFHGRDALTAALLAALPAPEAGPLMVVGPSGSGKSSLLRAGLVPALRARGLEVTVCAPSRASLERPVPESSLLTRRRKSSPTQEAANATPFSLTSPLGPDRSCWHCAVISMTRRCVIRTLPSAPNRQLIVGPMGETELRRAILEPARRANVEIEPGLVEVLLRDGRSTPAGGALPLLSHALLSTWERGRRNTMHIADYHATGGIAGAVATTAEAQHQALEETQRRFIRRALLRLVHPDEVLLARRRVQRDELPLASLDNQAALEGFIGCRLLTVDSDQVRPAANHRRPPCRPARSGRLSNRAYAPGPLHPVHTAASSTRSIASSHQIPTTFTLCQKRGPTPYPHRAHSH